MRTRVLSGGIKQSSGKAKQWGQNKRQAQMALALAVSLWIAGGGVASAGQTTTIETNHTGEVNGNHNNGDDLGDRTGDPNGNTVTVNEGFTVTGTVNGAYYFNINGNVTNNTVTVNGTVTNEVCGGISDRGYDVTGNHVAVTGTVGGDVYGGCTEGGSSGTATGNSVTVNGGTISMNVYGGYSMQGSATGNTVTLNNAKIARDVYGGYNPYSTGDVITGNTLNLSGVNTVDETVRNFETIQFDSGKLAWTGGSTVLTAQGVSNCGVLDVSAVTGKATAPGTMTLLQATESALPEFTLAYTGTNGKTTATLNSSNPNVTVQSGAKTAGTGGVTIGYNSTHTVDLDDTNKAITYTVANSPVNKITLGSIAWVKDGTVFDGAGYDFSNVFNYNNKTAGLVDWDFSGFKLTLADEAAYKSMAPGASMTLISNATGLEGATVAKPQVFDYTVANGAKLNTYVGGDIHLGKNYDNDSAHENKVTYDISSVRITSVNLAGWDNTKEAFAVPETWVPRGDNIYHPFDNIPVPVTAAGFTAPTITAGTSKEIITTNTANFFSDDKITGALKYAAQASGTDTARTLSTQEVISMSAILSLVK